LFLHEYKQFSPSYPFFAGISYPFDLYGNPADAQKKGQNQGTVGPLLKP
jgi:hypothetical protein